MLKHSYTWYKIKQQSFNFSLQIIYSQEIRDCTSTEHGYYILIQPRRVFMLYKYYDILSAILYLFLTELLKIHHFLSTQMVSTLRNQVYQSRISYLL